MYLRLFFLWMCLLATQLRMIAMLHPNVRLTDVRCPGDQVTLSDGRQMNCNTYCLNVYPRRFTENIFFGECWFNPYSDTDTECFCYVNNSNYDIHRKTSTFANLIRN